MYDPVDLKTTIHYPSLADKITLLEDMSMKMAKYPMSMMRMLR